MVVGRGSMVISPAAAAASYRRYTCMGCCYSDIYEYNTEYASILERYVLLRTKSVCSYNTLDIVDGEHATDTACNTNSDRGTFTECIEGTCISISR